jgi:type I restriction-modification system DNA methylase subunit
MNVNVTPNEQRRDADLKAGIRKRFAQVFVTLAIQAAILFFSAGKLDWVWVWIYKSPATRERNAQ